MKTMKVVIEYINFIQEERAKVNLAKLGDIDFYENGVKLEIPEEILNDFALTGLNNIDFITSGFYKGKELTNEDQS